MFGFWKKKKQGKIEGEFAWLTPKRVAEDFARDSANAKAAVTALIRLAILGGIKLKASLDEDKLLADAVPDQIVVCGIGFSWAFIFRNCLNSRNYDLNSDEELRRFVYMGAETLHSVLESKSGLVIQKNFSSQYPSHDFMASVDSLVGQLLGLSGVGVLEGAQDQIGTNFRVKAFASNYLPALIEASSGVLKIRESA